MVTNTAVTVLRIKINYQKKILKFNVSLFLGKWGNFRYIMWTSEKAEENWWYCSFAIKNRIFRT